MAPINNYFPFDTWRPFTEAGNTVLFFPPLFDRCILNSNTGRISPILNQVWNSIEQLKLDTLKNALVLAFLLSNLFCVNDFPLNFVKFRLNISFRILAMQYNIAYKVLKIFKFLYSSNRIISTYIQVLHCNLIILRCNINANIAWNIVRYGCCAVLFKCLVLYC